mgnify:CR=1 FL=1
MPNVNNIFRRGKVKKLNLERFDVFLEEQASLGPLVVSQYFNISRFPSVLPGGNSYFEIEGSKLLKPEVELKTELLDSSGQPIFHYALPKSPKSKKLKVTMQTASNVSNGVGRLIILGELNPNLIDVPEEFQDTYNVRLTGLVDINTSLPNTENIEFFTPPRMTVAEQVKGQIELPSDVDIMFVTKEGTATMTGDGIGFSGIGEELPDFISVPVINKVQIKNPSVDIDDSEEESTPTTTKAKTQRAGNAARQPQRDTTSQEREL